MPRSEASTMYSAQCSYSQNLCSRMIWCTEPNRDPGRLARPAQVEKGVMQEGAAHASRISVSQVLRICAARSRDSSNSQSYKGKHASSMCRNAAHLQHSLQQVLCIPAAEAHACSAWRCVRRPLPDKRLIRVKRALHLCRRLTALSLC